VGPAIVSLAEMNGIDDNYPGKKRSMGGQQSMRRRDDENNNNKKKIERRQVVTIANLSPYWSSDFVQAVDLGGDRIEIDKNDAAVLHKFFNDQIRSAERYLDRKYDKPYDVNLNTVVKHYCSSMKDIVEIRDDDEERRVYKLKIPKVFDKLPESIRSFDALEVLDLEELSGWINFPKWIGGLTNLKEIRFPRFMKIPYGSLTNLKKLKVSESLPDTIGLLTNLEELCLSDTTSSKLPKSIGALKNLRCLKITECKELKRLPHTIGALTNLRTLEIHSCKRLTTLPDSIGNLMNLQTLVLQKTGLKTLPDSTSGLVNLKYLDLEEADKLESLPEEIGTLVNLERIYLPSTTCLKTLPEGFENLINLKELGLYESGVLTLPGHTQQDTIYEAYSELHKRLRTLKKLALLDLYGFKLERKSWQQKLLDIISEFPLLDCFDCGAIKDKDSCFAIIRLLRKTTTSRLLCSKDLPPWLWPLILQKTHRLFGAIKMNWLSTTYNHLKPEDNIFELHKHFQPEDNIFELLVEYGPTFLSDPAFPRKAHGADRNV